MALKKCKECGAEISTSAKVCPHCGKNLKHPFVTALVVIIVIIFGVYCGVYLAGGIDNTGTSIINEKNEKITIEKFNKIETGMTYEEVVEIIGEEGTLSTESSYGSSTMQIYYWYASNGIANATISFQNGKVTAKSQIGLD